MSPFMSSMPAAGFMEMPPVSKHTPLPTKHSVLARFDLAPCHCMTTTREGRSLPCPTASSAPIFSASSCSSSSTSTSRPARGEIAHALGELDRAQHVGRLVDEIAGEEHALGQRLAGGERLGGGVGLCTGARTACCSPLRGSSPAPSSALRRLVFLEGVAPQQRPERQVGGKYLRPGLAKVGRFRDEARASPLRALICAKANPPSSRRSSSFVAAPCQPPGCAGRRCRPVPKSRSRSWPCRRTPQRVRPSSTRPLCARRCHAPQAQRQDLLLPAPPASRRAVPTAARTGCQGAGP